MCMSQTAGVILKLGNVPLSDIFKGRQLSCYLEKGVAKAPARTEWRLQLGGSDLGSERGEVWKTSEGGIRKSPVVMVFSFTTFLFIPIYTYTLIYHGFLSF